ncbi:hypothetical protein EGW08_019021 [Elysia chlorotica]|uniref:Uncharacterized protein n=1 Tax=Elysia chlorotica TaxID=188477 RepID=A0A433SVB0_ELYCH|nr:hypothetical protein EGW08_019021 [Elysia chlorotica]
MANAQGLIILFKAFVYHQLKENSKILYLHTHTCDIIYIIYIWLLQIHPHRADDKLEYGQIRRPSFLSAKTSTQQSLKQIIQLTPHITIILIITLYRRTLCTERCGQTCTKLAPNKNNNKYTMQL